MRKINLTIISLFVCEACSFCQLGPKTNAVSSRAHLRRDSEGTTTRSAPPSVYARLGFTFDTASAEIDATQEAPEGNLGRDPLPPTSEIAGVIFDMDGTLTRHCVDFADMRRRIYAIADADLGPENHGGGCILALSERLTPAGWEKADAVFKEVEAKALRDMAFNDGAAELCRYIDSLGIKRAIVTRNVETSVDAMHARLLEQEGVSMFYPAVARDTTVRCEHTGLNRALLSKPAPDAFCRPSDVIMVGDSEADDMVAAFRAGCGGRVLLAEGGKMRDTDSGGGGLVDDWNIKERQPTLTVPSLLRLKEILIANA